MRNITLPILAALSVVAASPCLAAEEKSEIVRTADLDLSSKSGMKALDGRIAQAIIRVCGPAEVRSIHKSTAQARCAAEAAASARQEIARLTSNNPTVALNR